MKAIVTVVGKDQVGIIAGVCNTLAAYEINVLDISQTIMEAAHRPEGIRRGTGTVCPHPEGGHLRRHAQAVKKRDATC